MRISSFVLLSIFMISFTYGYCPRVKYQFFISSLSPDSIKFLTGTFATAMSNPDFKLMAVLYFVPYGNARRNYELKVTCPNGENECYGNKLIACASWINTQYYETSKLVVCLESNINKFNQNFNEAFEECKKDSNINIPQDIYERIFICANSELGENLFADAGSSTINLVPALEHVPWILIDSVHNPIDEAQVLENILEYTCKAFIDSSRIQSCKQFEMAEDIALIE